MSLASETDNSKPEPMNETLDMLSAEQNTKRDEALFEKIMEARNTIVTLQKSSENDRVSKEVAPLLDTLFALEKEVCTLGAFMVYYEVTAHALLLGDDPKKALEYAASALTCAQILGHEAKQAELYGLLFQVAVFANHFDMAMHFLHQRKAFAPLDDEMQGALESMEALIENGLAPKPKFHVPEGELPVTKTLKALLQRGPSEIAARLICRADGGSLEQARRIAETLDEAQLAALLGR
jgi:hypothetical protein